VNLQCQIKPFRIPGFTVMSLVISAVITVFILSSGCSHNPAKGIAAGAKELHLKNLQQLTFDGTNAEAYFSPDGKRLIFQGHKQGGCDQMYVMNLDGSNRQLISHNGGRNTCGYFIDEKKVLFSSTHLAAKECPPEADKSRGYVWDIFKSYDVFTAKPDGSDVKQLTQIDGYDAESTVCGGKIVFTSARQGSSLQIYTMNLDGSGVEKLTHQVGYSGGAFFSPDCTRIVYRAYYPQKKDEILSFKRAVRKGFVPPSPLEIYTMNADGSKKTQLTAMKAASFAPSFFPSGDRVIFSSNYSQSDEPQQHQPGRVFQLWSLDARSKLQTNAEQITTEGTFNGFPMFSPDGKHLVFASNRNSSNPHELQLFLAEWEP